MPNFDDYLSPPQRDRPGTGASPREAFRDIPNGARVLITPGCGTPVQLLAELAEARNQWDALEIVAGQLLGPVAVTDFPGEPFRFTSVQPSEFMLAKSNGGHADPVPARYSDTSRLFRRDGPLPVDVALVQVSPPGPEGRFSLGVSVGGIIDAVRTAPLVIAQVNPQMPYTYGAAELERSEIDFLVDIEGPLVEMRRAAIGEEAQTIAKHVLTQVPDEATLQFGVGAVPEALMGLLDQRRDLGIHSGMISDGVVSLVESGAVTNAKKSFDQGIIITGEVMGTSQVFDWVDRNPLVRLAPAAYTHGASLIERCARFVSIQSALQVALDGTINAESLGDRQVAGPGGQPDYAAGAASSADAIAIHALPATAARGKVSRIVRQLDAGAIITTPRYLADRVVTEFGVAELRGRPLSQRAEALTAIAHPQFQQDLRTPQNT